MQNFYRLFLTIEDLDEEHRRFEIRVSPDAGQARRRQSFTMISCVTYDDLAVCLDDLGVTGWSQPAGESPSRGPVAEYVPSSVTELIEHLKIAHLSSLTLIAADTSVLQMNDRVARLQARGRDDIHLRMSA